MQAIVLTLVFVIASCSLSHAFTLHARPRQMSLLQMKSGGGYRKMLKKAKAKGPKKQGSPAAPAASPASTAPASPSVASSDKQSWESNTDGLSAKAKQEFKNKVPFSDDVYETIKAAVNLLSARSSKERTLLTRDEADWFAEAVEVIIEDANRYGPPKPPPRVEISEEERAAMQ
jgi:hypothetical protein